MKKKEF